VDLTDGSRTERYRGGVVLDWLPTPAVSYWAYGDSSELPLQATLSGVGLKAVPRIPKDLVPQQSKSTRRGNRVRNAPLYQGSSRLPDTEVGDGSAHLSYALLHVVNLPRFAGRPIVWPDSSARLGRLLLGDGDWTIILDEVPGADGFHEDLRNRGGFAFTHIARVQRTSGDRFTTDELKELVEAFTYFCWLCAEARCGPVLPVAFDVDDRPVWSRWNTAWVESFPNCPTWLDEVHADEAEALFPGFMARFNDPYWRQVLVHAINYLIEAGRPHTIDRAVVMAQVLLEAASYSWLVEELKCRTHDRFERKTSAQNIRAMVTRMGIPVSTPKRFTALAKTRTSKGHKADGPAALVVKRNEVVHRRASTTRAKEYDSRIEAWRLGAWYSELTVLRICGFNGLYRSRLSEDIWTGAVELVPWR
jgi:hypothetical protein